MSNNSGVQCLRTGKVDTDKKDISYIHTVYAAGAA